MKCSDVLCIFKARDNCWINATEKFNSRAAAISPDLTTLLPTESAPAAPSATATESSTPPPPPAAANGVPFPKILGAVLGSVIGLALLLIGILIFLRWKKKRRTFFDLGHQRRSSGLSDAKMDFQDRGLPITSTTRQLRHGPQPSAGSFSSVTNLVGRTNGHQRGYDKETGSGASDSSSQFNKDYKAAISNPRPVSREQAYRIPQDPFADEKAPKPTIATASATPRPRAAGKPRQGSMRRSSGWNKYWSGGSTLNIFGFGKRATVADDQATDRSSGSRYSDPRVPSQVTQASAMVPPLNIGERPEMQRINSGVPSYQNSLFPFPRASVGQLQRPGSVSTLSSFDGQRDAFSSGIPESIYDDFSATRQSSNVFSDSNYPLRAPESPQPAMPTSYQTNTDSADMSWLNLGEQRRL